jgi:hypothetical protein
MQELNSDQLVTASGGALRPAQFRVVVRTSRHSAEYFARRQHSRALRVVAAVEASCCGDVVL